MKPGSIIGIKFTNANSASNVTLNVNGSGAKSIAYASTYPYTGTSTTYCGAANTVNFYMYDGTYWYFLAHGSDNNSDTIPSGYCTTAAATAAKTASCGYWTATANSYLHIVFRYANTSAGAITLNVNSTGAKPIYINGTASGTSNYDLKAGSYLAFYDGTNFYFRTDGKLTASITGDAATVNGHTVAVDVPSNAKFTDATTTDHGLMTAADKIKLNGIATEAEVNVQSDWSETDTSSDAYIKNKPTIPTVGNGALTVKAGTSASGSFTANQSGASTITIDATTHKELSDAIAALPSPMVFKGTLGTSGTITSLPTAAASNTGWTYKVITAGTYASQVAKVGDIFILSLKDGEYYYGKVLESFKKNETNENI